jgi:hypothetical protein
MSKQKSRLPEHLLNLLSAAEKANGLPLGTMSSVLQQEIGGQLNKFLGDPTAYHYPVGPDGRRVAKHTGKVSTAFGPFGILESTAAQPGYGVKPLQNKSLEEQVRFSAEYLAARSKRAGGLVQGLAAYGEGPKYGAQVAGRLVKPVVPSAQAVVTTPAASAPTATSAPVVTAQAPAEAVAPVVQAAQPQSPVQEAWGAFLERVNAQGAPAAQPVAQALGQYGMPQVNVPDFLGAVASASARPQAGAFNQFSGLGTWGMR